MTSDGGTALRLGGEAELPGEVVVRFVDLDRWVGFQISHRPQLPWLLLASGLLFGGLVPALYAYRRRLWVTARPDGPHTLVTVAGRAFQRPQAFDTEYQRILRRLAEAIAATPPEPTEPADPVGGEPAPDAAAASRGRS
jgi:cytochrome c biogenesis protein